LKDISIGKNREEKTNLLIKSFTEHNFPLGYESKKTTYYRVLKAKEEIRKIMEEEGLEDGELLVVAHVNYFLTFNATEFDENFGQVDGKIMGNAEVLEFLL